MSTFCPHGLDTSRYCGSCINVMYARGSQSYVPVDVSTPWRQTRPILTKDDDTERALYDDRDDGWNPDTGYM